MYLSFNISFPYKIQKRKIDYIFKEYRVSKNKSLEIQVSKFRNAYTLFGLCIRPSWYTDHSGIDITFELFNYTFIINLYDHRHWDYEKGTWSTENE